MATEDSERSRDANARDMAYCRAQIDEAVSARDWAAIFRRLARSKSVRASELLLKYRYGTPPPASVPAGNIGVFQMHMYRPDAEQLAGVGSSA